MTRSEILFEIKKFFTVKELVCEHVYAKWGESSWQFLDTNYLHCLLVIRRDILGRPMVCNYKGHFQRGLRCNRCQLVNEKRVPYLSAHVLGKAGDFTVTGIKADKAREIIKTCAGMLPCPVRLEMGVNWLHFDVLPQYGVKEKVYEFSA